MIYLVFRIRYDLKTSPGQDYAFQVDTDPDQDSGSEFFITKIKDKQIFGYFFHFFLHKLL